MRAALREAIHVADTVTTPDKRRGFAPPADVHLRSLAYALYENAFLRDYIERELGTLLAHDKARRRNLYGVIASLCRHAGNESATAADLFLSRTASCEKIAAAEKILNADLGDPETIIALHFAFVARETAQWI